MKYFFFLIILILPSIVLADLLKPSPIFNPKKVVSIQLTALKGNDIPYKNVGIEQTWEFAHPSNQLFTVPLSNFTKMMYSKHYSILLNHQDLKIIVVKKEENISYFFIEIIDKFGNKFGFQWIVEKVVSKGIYNNCWMTIGVSEAMQLSKSI